MTREKLGKVIKDKLDIENVDIERRHRVKRNTDNNDNDEQNYKPQTIAGKLLHYKDKKKISWVKQNKLKLEDFVLKRFFKRNFRNKKSNVELCQQVM